MEKTCKHDSCEIEIMFCCVVFCSRIFISFYVNQFSVACFCRSVRYKPRAVISTRISLYSEAFSASRRTNFRALELQSSVNVVMEKLQIDGQSIKFVDRKLWKRDSIEGKLNFEGKFYSPAWSTGTDREREGKSGGEKIKKKCPTVIELPRKRRILKRPKRFKNYYSDREPLEIPSFSFPRWSLHCVNS